MSVLITGAAGFIGSHLTERILESGEDVVGLDSFDTFYDPAIKEENLTRARSHDGFRLVRGDIRHTEVVSGLPDDIDTIIHLAARAGGRPLGAANRLCLPCHSPHGLCACGVPDLALP